MIDFTQQATCGFGNKPLEPQKKQHCCAEGCPMVRYISTGEDPAAEWTCKYHKIARKEFWPDVTNRMQGLFNVYFLACALRDERVNGMPESANFNSQEKFEIASILQRAGAPELMPKTEGEGWKRKYAERIFAWFQEQVIPLKWRLSVEDFMKQEEAKNEKNIKGGDLYDFPYKGYKTRIGRMFCRLTEKTQRIDLPPLKADPEDRYGIKKIEEYCKDKIKSQYSLSDSGKLPESNPSKTCPFETLTTTVEKVKKSKEVELPSRPSVPDELEKKKEEEEEEDLPF